MQERTNTTTRDGITNLVPTGSNFSKAYGSSFSSLFKPFTTKTDARGIPHYEQPLTPSGNIYATSSGLNPFGVNTVFENIYAGDSLPEDLASLVPDPENVRTHGLKAPLHLVGWGYDIFGMPVPNYNEQWGSSGYYSNNAPSPSFLGSGSTQAEHGRETPLYTWRAGPVDLRWDMVRGVWSSNSNGVYAARILDTHVSGDVFIEGSSYFAEHITYDAVRYDGVADQMMVSGISHIGPKPATGTYKIRPLASGDFCFIVHYPDSDGIPSYALWAVESPGSESCEVLGNGTEGYNGIYGGAGDGPPEQSSGLLTGASLFDGLDTYQLGIRYGGIGRDNVPTGTVLVGNGTGELLPKTLIQGSGIEISETNGELEIRFASGVQFITSSGVNNSITELTGLTVPLSISQGGTGSSSKNFVDLTSNQSIQGIKTFADRIVVGSGNITNPSIRFSGGESVGFYYETSGIQQGLRLVSSGTTYQVLRSTGTLFKQSVEITNDQNEQFGPVLVVKKAYNQSASIGYDPNQIFEIRDSDDSFLMSFDASGKMLGNYTHLLGGSGAPTLIIESSGSALNPLEIYNDNKEVFSFNYNGTRLNFSSGYIDVSGDTRINLTDSYIKFKEVKLEAPTGVPQINSVVRLPSSGILVTQVDVTGYVPMPVGYENYTYKTLFSPTGDYHTFVFTSGQLVSHTQEVSLGDPYHGIPQMNGVWPANNPNDGYFCYRTDEQELYRWDDSRNKWLGEKEFVNFGVAGTISSGTFIRQFGSVIPNGSTRGWGPPYDITVIGINGRWVTSKSAVECAITQDGTIVGTISGNGTYIKDMNLNIDVSGDTVLGLKFGFADGGTVGNPILNLYFRRKGTP